MLKFTMSFLSLVLASSAWAGDFSVEVGFRQQSGQVESGMTAESQIGFQVGGVGVFEISGPLGLRTGMMYVSRPLVVKNDSTDEDSKYTMNYFEVPAALSYSFEDYASVFGGLAFSMNLDSSATNGMKAENVKSFYMPIIVGASFKFAPQLGGTIFFETSGGDVADGLTGYRAVGANLSISFE